MEGPRDGEALSLPSPRSPGSPRRQRRRCGSTDGAAAPVPSASETPPSVLRRERSPTNSGHRRSPGVDSAARRLATQLDELAVDPAPPMDCDGGVPLNSVEQPIWLRPPLRWPSLRRGRCADALRTDRQLKASKPMKRRPRVTRVDASAGTGSTAPWPSARALALSQRLAGRA